MRPYYYNVEIWEEVQLPYGTGTRRVKRTLWDRDRLRQCRWNEKLDHVAGINLISVIQSERGEEIAQISGYNYRKGLYCYSVDPETGDLVDELVRR